MAQRLLYIESVAGAAGDMLIAALSACGIDWDEFIGPLRDAFPGVSLEISTVSRSGISARSFRVAVSERQPERHLAEVIDIVQAMRVPDSVKDRSAKAFRRLARVEAECHGVDMEHVHFHELGAVDSIIDVVGYFWALHLLKIDKVFASPLRLGWGKVNTAHGELVVPVPAVAGLVRGFPVEAGPGPGELTTPTGALLVTESAGAWGTMPAMIVEYCGSGAGQRETPSLNIVRTWVGEADGRVDLQRDLVGLECNIDDMTPEQLSFLRERLEDIGAVDVTILNGIGKKGRPVHLVQVLVCNGERHKAVEVLFRHSSTLGIRIGEITRVCLPRVTDTVEVPGGRVRVKRAWLRDEMVSCSPEYEDCAAISRATGRPIMDIMSEARNKADLSLPRGCKLEDRR